MIWSAGNFEGLYLQVNYIKTYFYSMITGTAFVYKWHYNALHLTVNKRIHPNLHAPASLIVMMFCVAKH